MTHFLDSVVFAVALVGQSRSLADGLVFLYISPDQIMPLTSVLGGVIGLLLMFWNRVVGAFRRVKAFCSRR